MLTVVLRWFSDLKLDSDFFLTVNIIQLISIISVSLKAEWKNNASKFGKCDCTKNITYFNNILREHVLRPRTYIISYSDAWLCSFPLWPRLECANHTLKATPLSRVLRRRAFLKEATREKNTVTHHCMIYICPISRQFVHILRGG